LKSSQPAAVTYHGRRSGHLYQLWDTLLAPCLAAHPDIARYGPGPNYGPGYPGACRAALTLRADYARYEWMRDAASIAVLVVPALIGLFWGAPLIAPELAEGTWKLAWTQTITRTRWAAARLAVAGAASPYLHLTLPPNVQNAWVLSDQVVNAAGHPAPAGAYLACGAPGTASRLNACLVRFAAHYHQVLTLQPASRYWPFQAYETAIFAVAALLLAGCRGPPRPRRRARTRRVVVQRLGTVRPLYLDSYCLDSYFSWAFHWRTAHRGRRQVLRRSHRPDRAARRLAGDPRAPPVIARRGDIGRGRRGNVRPRHLVSTARPPAITPCANCPSGQPTHAEPWHSTLQ